MFEMDQHGEWEKQWELKNPEPDGIGHIDWLDRRFDAYKEYVKNLQGEPHATEGQETGTN